MVRRPTFLFAVLLLLAAAGLATAPQLSWGNLIVAGGARRAHLETFDVAKIAFASKRDGDWEIYTMDADGQRQTRLTTNSVHDPNHPPYDAGVAGS